MKINNISRIVKRGDIFDVDFGVDNIVGSEQSNYRPCICIQNPIGNKYSTTVIVAVITSKLTKKKMPTHCEIGVECGLDVDSLILCEQIKTIDKRRLSEYKGKATDDIMKKVDRAIEVSLHLAEGKACTMTNEEKVANVKANAIKSIDTTLRELLRENESMAIINKYMTKRENRIEELNRYCTENNLDYRKFYNTATDNRKIQSK